MQFSKVMNTSVIVFAITMSSVFTANAQFSCKIEGVVKQEGKPLTGAIVSLVSNSETLKEVVTGSTGTYSLNLEPNEEYSVYITKAGFIKAELVFSTLGLTEEDAQIFKNILKPETSIFEYPADNIAVEQINKALDKPLKSYYYSVEKKSLITDDVYDQSMQKELLAVKKIAADASENLMTTEAKEKERLAREKALTEASEKKRLEEERMLAASKEREQLEREKSIAAATEKKRLDEVKALTDAKERERVEKEKAIAAAKEKSIAEAAEMKRLEEEKILAAASAKERLENEQALAKTAEKKRLDEEKAIAAAKEKEQFEKEKALAAEKKQLEQEKALADAAEKIRIQELDKLAILDKKYTAALTQGDSAFQSKNYSLAKSAFNEALNLKPSELYPRNRLAETEAIITSAYTNELAKKYPQGMTEEITKESNAKVTKRIVVEGNIGYLFIKKETTFGAVYYFKDGISITEQEYRYSTEPK